MNGKINYQIILDDTLKNIEKCGNKPHLMLHSCCAPCSSYVLEYLQHFFKIIIFYYNPNIFPENEFEFRFCEQKRLIREMNLSDAVEIVKGKYEPDNFFTLARGLESEAEGSKRCLKCYRLRLEKTAEIAAKYKCDYFCTTLTVSPHKNAEKLNETGKELSDIYNVSYLYSDFKKKNGYKRSCELSEIYSLYRQNYCGCIYSKNTALPKSSSSNEKSL